MRLKGNQEGKMSDVKGKKDPVREEWRRRQKEGR